MANPKALNLLLLAFLLAGAARSEECSELMQLLFNQIETQQFLMQELVRSGGHSGVVEMRNRRSATNNYQTDSHVSTSALAMHDHSDYGQPPTMGMGEMVASLNGYWFKTRHNDYRLVMPSNTSTTLRETQNVPMPGIPDAVTKKATVEEQIDELREWFKAWIAQNYTVRDYRPYFRPVLCYMEGAWFKSGLGKAIVESFKSKRHFLDANTWAQLSERIRFNQFTGSKSRLENLALLPSALMGMQNATTPQLAQWNYRILCHPIEGDLPLDFLHPIEDLAGRFFRDAKFSFERFVFASRGARFGLNAKESPERGGQYQYGLLDKLMGQVPGLNNYPGDIKSDPKDPDRVLAIGGKTLMNQAYYHRVSQAEGNDASGLDLVHRGYNDDYFFGAQTTHEQIAGRTYTPACRLKKTIPADCPPVKLQRWTWAIPLEVAYLTPLNTWNPYDVEIHTDSKLMTDNGKRDGSCSQDKAYNGTFINKGYYLTPYSFYSKAPAEGGAPADTVRDKVCLLDKKGDMKEVRASGMYIHLPKIQGINGRVRIRYPVHPVYGEGSSVWKELNALRDLVMDPDLDQYKHSGPAQTQGFELQMSQSQKSGTPIHTHTIDVDGYDAAQLRANVQISVTSSQEIGHSHQLEIVRRIDKGKEKFWYKLCDTKAKCWDEHATSIYRKLN